MANITPSVCCGDSAGDFMVGLGLGLGLGNGQTGYLQEIDKIIDKLKLQSLNGILDTMQSLENTLDGAAVPQKVFLNNALSEINKVSKKIIGDNLWPASDVEFVSQTLGGTLPITVKLVNKAVIKPGLRISRDYLHKHVESYKK
jgi:hypothetical protein